MDLLTLANDMEGVQETESKIRVKAVLSSSRPALVVKTSGAYLQLDLTRADTSNVVDFLRGNRTDVAVTTHGCKIGRENGRLIFVPSEISRKAKCALPILQEEIQELVEVLEGWYSVVSEHPFVKYLCNCNTIQCNTYEELDNVLRTLKQEGIRFRDGECLDATKYDAKIITAEHPMYVSRRQNSAYTDSPRESDFVCCDFGLYENPGKVLRPSQISNN